MQAFKLIYSCLLLLNIAIVQFGYMMSALASTSKKVAVVTGANKGIGFEICKKLGDAGIKTIMACRNEDLGRKAAAELLSTGLDVEYRNLDINNEQSIKDFAASLSRDYPHIDILVNNAAIAYKGSDPTPFQQQARPTVKANYFGTVNTVINLLPLLQASPNEPRIVNVASMAGHLKILKTQALNEAFTSPSLTPEGLNDLMRGFVDDVEAGRHSPKGWPNTCYGTSKLGVVAFTKVLAREYPSILSVCCCPGYVQTDMSSQGGSKTPAEGALTPALLCITPPEGGGITRGGFYQHEREIQW